jgi:signal transduction histidine kinase
LIKYTEKVLFVDDEPRVLSGLRRRLFGRFATVMASSSAEALRVLETTADIAVVVADMRMPEMTGIELLGIVRSRWPEIRRIMLTGNTDQETALSAINEGKVFHFFCKPVDADLLAQALEAAIDEYRFSTDTKAELHHLTVIATSAERARVSFLSMMNHELRTPLNHILGFAALLEQRCRQRGEHDLLEYLAYIRESGQGLFRTVNRIMEVARLAAGHAPAHLSVFDLAEVISEQVTVQRQLAVKRDITISFEIPQSPLCVEADLQEFAQGIAELLDNAVKFNRPGGHVSVALSWTGEDLAIRIADTGIGMAEADVQRVLGAFCQEDDAATRRYEGIGVGLTLATLTAQAYGGNIAIESRKDHGTVVVMRLRRVVAAARQAAKIA